MSKVENAFATAVGFNTHGAKVLNVTTVAETLARAQLEGREMMRLKDVHTPDLDLGR